MRHNRFTKVMVERDKETRSQAAAPWMSPDVWLLMCLLPSQTFRSLQVSLPSVCAGGEGESCLHPALRWCAVGAHGYERKQAWLRYRWGHSGGLLGALEAFPSCLPDLKIHSSKAVSPSPGSLSGLPSSKGCLISVLATLLSLWHWTLTRTTHLTRTKEHVVPSTRSHPRLSAQYSVGWINWRKKIQ